MDFEQVFAKIEMPPASKLLGWEFVSFDPERQEFIARFDGKQAFTNPRGVIQGGILTAMVDDTMGPAVLAASQGKQMCMTIDMHTHFLRPVKPGNITCRARVVRLGRQIAFIEAELFDAEEEKCLRASSSARLASVG